VLITVNSDDPAYFSGYVEDNYVAVAQAFALDRTAIVGLVRNSFHASLLSRAEIDVHLARLDGLQAAAAGDQGAGGAGVC
jgi:adenosine deaminase